MIIKYLKNNKYLILFLIFFLCMIIYSLDSHYVGSGDTVPNELLPITIIKEKNLDFNEFYVNKDPTQELPYYFREVKGRIISGYPIIPGLLNLPTYFIAYLIGIDITSYIHPLSKFTAVLIVSLTTVFLYLVLKQILKRSKNALFFSLIFAFATNAWTLASRGIWQHGPAMLFFTLTLFFIFNKNEKVSPWAGFFLGLSIFNRPINILIVLPLLIYIYFNQKKVFWKSLILFFVPLFFLIIYSLIYFGNISSMGHMMGMGNGYHFINLFKGLAGILVSPSRGLLLYTPIFIFSLIFLFYQLFSPKSLIIFKYFSIILIITLLLYGNFHLWWGGSGFYSYRYLVDVIPFLIIFLAKFWEEEIYYKKNLKIIFFIFLFISFYAQIIGNFYFPAIYLNRSCEIDLEESFRWDYRESELWLGTLDFYNDFKKII